MLARAKDGWQPVRNVDGRNRRFFVLTAASSTEASMRFDLQEMLAVARGDISPQSGVTGVTGVTAVPRYASKSRNYAGYARYVLKATS